MKHLYPAVFTQEADGRYSVTFPDLVGCFTEGDTWQEAYNMAIDAIGLYLQNDKNEFVYPSASNPQDIKTEINQFIMPVEFDEINYLRKNGNQSVKKTLTIPAWLNSLAEKNHVNFSGTLQAALKHQLNID